MTHGDCVLSEIRIPRSRVRLHHISSPAVPPSWSRLLILHGYGEHSGRYVPFMRWLADRGVASAAIDFRGHGRSTGRRGFIRRWDEYIDDLEAFLETHAGGAGPSAPPLFMLGHSHGGLVMAAAGERGILNRAGVTACVFSSPYLKSRMPVPTIKRLLARAANHLAPWLRVSSGIQGQWLTSDPAMAAEDFVDPLNLRIATPRWYVTVRAMQLRVMADAPSFKLPMLCLAGSSDIIADPAATAEFYRRGGSADKSLYVYPGHVHELLRELAREQIFEDVIGWMKARGP